MVDQPCVVRINYSTTEKKLECKLNDCNALLYKIEWIRDAKENETQDQHGIYIIHSIDGLTADEVRLLPIFPQQILLFANKTIDISISPCVKIEKIGIKKEIQMKIKKKTTNNQHYNNKNNIILPIIDEYDTRRM